MPIAEIVDKYVYVREDIDPSLNLIEEIPHLREEKKTIILTHYYQEAYIQEIADYVGDSVGLSRQAERTDADIILFAGFMDETAKILNPEKKVLIPDLHAGCSPEESCSPEQLQNPECQENVLEIADFIGFTSELLKFVVEDETDIYIVATKPCILYQMRKKEPYKTFITAPISNLCACNHCSYMNRISLRYNTLK